MRLGDMESATRVFTYVPDSDNLNIFVFLGRKKVLHFETGQRLGQTTKNCGTESKRDVQSSLLRDVCHTSAAGRSRRNVSFSIYFSDLQVYDPVLTSKSQTFPDGSEEDWSFGKMATPLNHTEGNEGAGRRRVEHGPLRLIGPIRQFGWMAGESRRSIAPLWSPSPLADNFLGRDRWKNHSICQQTELNKHNNEL